MIAAAEFAAMRLQDLPSANTRCLEIDRRDRVFCLLDKDGDGKISIEELMEVMEELGAEGEDAREMMELLDSNSDGSLSSDEFDLFQKQVHVAKICFRVMMVPRRKLLFFMGVAGAFIVLLCSMTPNATTCTCQSCLGP